MTLEAVLNLVMNAIEACPVLPAVVHVAIRPDGGFAELEIRDGNGPVDPAILARIGQERFSTKPEGTGLGLNIVQRLIKEGNAALHVHTQPGEGTTFTVYLPGAELVR